MPTEVLYHANCDDGFGAAFSIWKALGDEDVRYTPVQYGSSPPDVDDNTSVYIVDFSYPREEIEKLASQVRFLRILDHHKTAQSALEDLDYAKFDMDRSGAMMAWNYFHQGDDPPTLIKYIQDRDLWNLELPQTREFTAALRSYTRWFDSWDSLMIRIEEDFEGFVAEGSGILRYMDKMVARAIWNATMQDIGGYSIPVVNETIHFSEVAGGLAEKHPNSPFGAAYFIRSDGKRQWSLRSVGDFDVGEFAKQFGGGGHRNAAGFTEE